jgi:hypothetical protein
MSAPLPGIVDEARRIVAAAAERSLPVRLVGGLAVRLRASEPVPAALAREYQDIDLVTLKGKGKDVGALLRDLGYAPQERFNAINGHERLLFHDLANGRQLDVFVGAFRMCHEIPVTGRIVLDPVAVPLAELLLTKLQVVKLNEKDQRDIVALLYDHDVAESDGDTVNGAEVGRLCADDWGLWRTSRGTLARVRERIGDYDLPAGGRERVLDRIDRLEAAIEHAPKSRSWRMRDRIGDRKQWYVDPEEVGG